MDLAADFKALTGLDLPPRLPNRLEDRVVRRDTLFQTLSGWAFDHPDAIPGLLAWARSRTEPGDDCATWELYGYLCYVTEDWREAARAFMRSLEREPDNLDAWLDLAFTLRHMGVSLGDSILFDHTEYIRECRERPPGRLDLFALRAIEGRIRREGLAYEDVYPEWIEPYRPALG